MLTKKLTDKSLCVALVLLGVVILLLVYFLPVKQVSNQISSLESENKTIKSHIASLKEYYDNRAQYQTDTEDLKKLIATIASSYPSMYRVEDYIMEAVDVENAAELTYSSIDVADSETLIVVDENTVKGANMDEYQQSISFNEQSVSYSNDIDYHNLKDALAEIFASDYKLNIQSISYTCDEETGNLTGAFVLGYYYVSGNGIEYTEPTIAPFASGTTNIFGYMYDIVEEEESDDGAVSETENAEQTAEGAADAEAVVNN